MAKSGKATKKRGKRRTGEQVKELLAQVDALRKGGEPLMKALAKLGISYSNFNYWTKKRTGSAAPRGKAQKTRKAGGAPRGGVISVLDQMRANRSQRSEIEKQLRALDAAFDRLKSKLGAV